MVLLWITFSGICFKVLGGSQRVIPRNLLRGVHLVDDAEASTSTQPTASTNSSRSTTSSISTSSSPADSEPSPPLPNQTHQTPNHQNQTKLQVDPTNFSDRLEVAGRTAICVVGGLRSFTLPKIYQSILKFKAKVDPATVFLVMHETASLGHDTRKQVPFKVGKQSLKASVDALQPVHVEVHSDSTCKQFESVEPNVSCCSDDVVSNYLQLGWIWHCLNVVKQYEAEHNVTFELIVRLRPDVVYFGLEYLPSKERLQKNGITLAQKQSRKQPADWLFILSPSSLEWFSLTMLDVQRRCDLKKACRASGINKTQCQRQDVAFHSPEYSGWFRQEHGQFVRDQYHWTFDAVDLEPAIVRSKDDADCFRLLRLGAKCAELTRKGWDKARRLKAAVAGPEVS